MPQPLFSRRTFLSTAAAAAATGPAILLPPKSEAAVSLPTAQSSEGSLQTNLDNYIAAYMKSRNAPGLTLALASKEKPLHTQGYGFADVDQRLPVNPDHLYQIGSITKSFVALVILQLHDEGKLDLHAPILDYLPGLPLSTPFGTITTHHLLTHTSGLPDNIGPFQADPSARLIQGFTPGEHFHYCNAAFDILGLLAAKLDGRPWRVAVSERILKPLGMDQTAPVISGAIRSRSAVGYQPFRIDEVYPRQGKLAPAPFISMDDTAGCIASTPGDMALYARMLLNGGKGPKGRIVSEESFTLFSTPHIKAEEFSPTASYGYGIAVDTLDGHKILRHTGGMIAFASSIHVDLDGGVAAFASINAMQGYRPTAVTEYAVRLLRAQAESKPLPANPDLDNPLDVKNAQDYAGTFTAPNGSKLTFEAKDTRLFLIDGANSIPLEHAGGDAFLSTISGSRAAYPFLFERKPQPPATPETAPPQPVLEVSYGPEWFPARANDGPRSFHTPPTWASYVGTYHAESPWGGDFEVYIHKDRLVLEGGPLSPLGEGLFRTGDEPWAPDTAEFLQPFEGKSRILRLSGMDCWRIDIA